MIEGLISVIVPIYNTQDYLDRCITSIINQHYKNLEIILIDDGSSDDSILICQKYEKLDSRIRTFRKKNGGQSSARNLGLDYAQGEYIGFVDSDDWIDSAFFSTLQYNLEHYHADVSVVNYQITDGFMPISENKKEYIEQWEPSDAIGYFIRQSKTNVAVWNKLYRAHLLKNARFKEGQYYEEYYFQFLALKDAQKVVYNNSVLYNYFQRNNSTVHTKTAKKEFDNILAFYDSLHVANYAFPNERHTCKKLMAEHVYFFVSCEKFSKEMIDSNKGLFERILAELNNKSLLNVMENPLEIVTYTRQFHNRDLSYSEKSKLQHECRQAYRIEKERLTLKRKIKYLLYCVCLGLCTIRNYTK